MSTHTSPLPPRQWMTVAKQLDSDSYGHEVRHIKEELNSCSASSGEHFVAFLRWEFNNRQDVHLRATPTDPAEKKKQKRTVSFTSLIGMAILDSPDQKLQLQHIYKYVQQRLPPARRTSNKWKNCVRHNLSQSDRFLKLGRHDSRGNFWSINPKYFNDVMKMVVQNEPGYKRHQMTSPVLLDALGRLSELGA